MATLPVDPERDQSVRALVGLVSCLIILEMTLYSAIVPLLSYYKSRFGLSTSEAGVLSASYAAGLCANALPAGWLVGRAGARGTAMVGVGAVAICSAAFGVANGTAMLIALRFLQGAGAAWVWTGGLAWLVTRAPRERVGEVVGTVFGAAMCGALLGPVIAAVAGRTSPGAAFGGTALLATGLLVWAGRTDDGVGEHKGGDLRRFVAEGVGRNRSVVVAGLWLTTLAAVLFGVITVLGPLRLSALGASRVEVAGIFFMAAAVQGAGSRARGKFHDRRGGETLVRFGLVASAAMLVVLSLADSKWFYATLVTVYPMGFAALVLPASRLLSVATDSAGLHQGVAFGIWNLAWAGGEALGAAVGPAVAQATNDRVTYWGLGVLCVLTLAVGERHRAVWVATTPKGSDPS